MTDSLACPPALRQLMNTLVGYEVKLTLWDLIRTGQRCEHKDEFPPALGEGEDESAYYDSPNEQVEEMGVEGDPSSSEAVRRPSPTSMLPRRGILRRTGARLTEDISTHIYGPCEECRMRALFFRYSKNTSNSSCSSKRRIGGVVISILEADPDTSPASPALHTDMAKAMPGVFDDIPQRDGIPRLVTSLWNSVAGRPLKQNFYISIRFKFDMKRRLSNQGSKRWFTIPVEVIRQWDFSDLEFVHLNSLRFYNFPIFDKTFLDHLEIENKNMSSTIPIEVYHYPYNKYDENPSTLSNTTENPNNPENNINSDNNFNQFEPYYQYDQNDNNNVYDNIQTQQQHINQTQEDEEVDTYNEYTFKKMQLTQNFYQDDKSVKRPKLEYNESGETNTNDENNINNNNNDNTNNVLDTTNNNEPDQIPFENSPMRRKPGPKPRPKILDPKSLVASSKSPMQTVPLLKRRVGRPRKTDYEHSPLGLSPAQLASLQKIERKKVPENIYQKIYNRTPACASPNGRRKNTDNDDISESPNISPTQNNKPKSNRAANTNTTVNSTTSSNNNNNNRRNDAVPCSIPYDCWVASCRRLGVYTLQELKNSYDAYMHIHIDLVKVKELNGEKSTEDFDDDGKAQEKVREIMGRLENSSWNDFAKDLESKEEMSITSAALQQCINFLDSDCIYERIKCAIDCIEETIDDNCMQARTFSAEALFLAAEKILTTFFTLYVSPNGINSKIQAHLEAKNIRF